MRALNFYPGNYHANLLTGLKRCTIRLGDKTGKYAEGDVVWVTHGPRFEPRRKIFAAVIDAMSVKGLAQVTAEELAGENPDMKAASDLTALLEAIYRRPVPADALVSVIHFSKIVE